MTEEEINQDEEVETEVDVMEFSLCDDEIEELIDKLHLLKEEKNPITFEIDDENELLINYDESELNEDEDEE